MDRDSMYQSLSDRFDRLDEKLDVLVSTMARYEERLSAGNSKFERHEYRLDHIEGRVNVIENDVSRAHGRGMIFERAAWVIFSAALAILVTYFK